MKTLLRRFFGAGGASLVAEATLPVSAAERGIVRAGEYSFDLGVACRAHDGLPHPRWELVHEWMDTLPPSERASAWTACERAWLATLADALGDGYQLHESPHAFVLSRQRPREAAATLAYVGKTLRRVQTILEELAQTDGLGKQILLLFSDADAYYRYVGAFYPEEGEFAMSAGLYLHGPCGHFVVHGEEMWRFEPTIVHEMTHALLAHLPIPAWLNEGMAVNSEQRLARVGDDIHSVRALEAKHRRFWTAATIQDFWNGAAYRRTDEGRELAYDLGRIIVNGMSSDWPGLKRFAAHAQADDGGDAAAREHLDLDLGEFVRHFLRAEPGPWGPLPEAWRQAPEHGAFAPPR